MFQMLSFLICLVGILISVAFFTLLERKVMGVVHYRLGPSKLIIWGLSQPLSDAAKLLCKEMSFSSYSKKIMFFLGPLLGMSLMMIMWIFFSFTSVEFSSMKILLVVMISSLTVFMFLLTSWGSFSKYSLLGGYRAIGQTISYEACLWGVILILFYLVNLPFFNSYLMNFSLFFVSPLLFLLWLFIWLAELNRTPFDMAESESELVSGYNVEYSAGLFTVLFITEYGFMLFISYLTSFLFFSGNVLLELKMVLISSLLVWVRCSFPRMRYESMMTLSWKVILPFVCLFLPPIFLFNLF